MPVRYAGRVADKQLRMTARPSGRGRHTGNILSRAPVEAGPSGSIVMRIWRFAIIIFALGAACPASARLSAPRLSRPTCSTGSRREGQAAQRRRADHQLCPLLCADDAAQDIRPIARQSPDGDGDLYARPGACRGRLVATVEDAAAIQRPGLRHNHHALLRHRRRTHERHQLRQGG